MRFDNGNIKYYAKQLKTKDEIIAASERNELTKELDIEHNKEWVSVNCVTMLNDLKKPEEIQLKNKSAEGI